MSTNETPAEEPTPTPADAVPEAAPPPPSATPAMPAAPAAQAGGRFALRAGAAVVAAALVGVGIGLGILQVAYPAPHSAAAPVPNASPSASPSAAPSPIFGAKSNGNHFGSLSDLLLPVPSGDTPGPDDGAYGNNNVLNAQQLATDLDDSVKNLPQDKQQQVKDAWQSLHMLAGGVRTFMPADDSMVVTLRLRQFNQQAVKAESELVDAMGSDSGLFREGPQVPGHPEAHCFLPFEPPGAPIDYLECSAAEGDLLVVMNVQGIAPLPLDQAVSLFRQQLDRLAIPGASV